MYAATVHGSIRSSNINLRGTRAGLAHLISMTHRDEGTSGGKIFLWWLLHMCGLCL